MTPIAAEMVAPSRQLIAPRPHTTPVGVPRKARALPNDLLKEASRRLGITSLLLAGLWAAGAALRHLWLVIQSNGGAPFPFDVVDWIAGVIVLASSALFFDTCRPDRNPRFILDLGLA